MKILYHHRTRGTDAQLVHIREIVKAFREIGHQVDLAALVDIEDTSSDPKREADEAWWKKVARRIPLAYEAIQLAYNAAGIVILWRHTRRMKPDFIYERYAMFNFAGVAVAYLMGIPIVMEVNSPFAIEQQRDGEIRAVKLALWMERVICNAATKVIVVSTPLKRIMTGLGVKEERLALVPNGVNLGQFGAAEAEEDEDLGTPLGLEESVVIGFIGWFRNWHGLTTLLEAYDREHLSDLGAKVLLIGDGPMMPQLRRYVTTHNLERDVIFTGPLPHEEMHRYARLMDVAVQPAANEYCCPMKILEYMAMAKPIVAPRQENICELLEDGKDALLFEPGDPKSLGTALRKITGDRQLRKEMGKNAARAILEREYLWTRNAEMVVEMMRLSQVERGELKALDSPSVGTGRLRSAR